jgi:valyl-tRNA synthetase
MRETGYDILFFWVAREMMLGCEMTGETPFASVYLHGLVRNEAGDKISKSMENIDDYDPLNIIEKYGADVLRYTLLTSATPGLDMNLDPRRLEGARNFTNKIWQAARFVLSNLPESDAPELDLELEVDKPGLELPDRWVLSRLNRLIAQVTRLFESFQYGEAGRQIYDFLWGEYCDWYIEATKVRLYGTTSDRTVPQAVLLRVLETALRLLHPFAPFLTEAGWQALPACARKGEALIMAGWPVANASLVDDQAENEMGLVMDLIRGIRNRRAEHNVTPGRRIPALIAAGDATPLLEGQRAVLSALAKLDSAELIIRPTAEPPDQATTVVVGDTICYLPLAALVDLTAERERISKLLSDIDGRITHSEQLLAGEFAQKAPDHIVQRERDKLAGLQSEHATLTDRLAALE